MEFFVPGKAASIDQLSSGDCVLFRYSEEMHVGLILKSKDGVFSILDFGARDKHDVDRIQIYNANSFMGETVFHIEGARISPKIGPESMGLGMHKNGLVTKALYLTSDGPVVYAGYTHTSYKINVGSGEIYQGDLAYCIHATHWRIEYPDGSDRFTVIREIAA